MRVWDQRIVNIDPYASKTNGAIKSALYCLALAMALVGITNQNADAENLQNALISAYYTNPRLDAERARLRATDEEVPRAWSGFRPNITATAITGFTSSNTGSQSGRDVIGSNTDGYSYPKGYSLSLAQSIFSGFRTLNSVREAEAEVEAGREDLRAIQQTTLLQAATAYMDVIRNQAIVRLRERNVSVLAKEISVAMDRLNAGEVTSTDVSQARARRAGAASSLDLARAKLLTARAVYERVIGHPPSRLLRPGLIKRLLPGNLPKAEQIAQAEHPAIMAKMFREIIARHSVRRITGELLPELDVEATYSRDWDPARLTADTETATVMGRLTIPFYRGGEVSARVRQAKHTRTRRQREIDQARTEIKEGVATGWANFRAAHAQIRSDRAQVKATRAALAGIREEESIGQRTILDILDAEREFLNAQISLKSAQRDLTVTQYAVLASIGRLNVQHLKLPTQNYNPQGHLAQVRNEWFDLRIEHGNGDYDEFGVNKIDVAKADVIRTEVTKTDVVNLVGMLRGALR